MLVTPAAAAAAPVDVSLPMWWAMGLGLPSVAALLLSQPLPEVLHHHPCGGGLEGHPYV